MFNILKESPNEINDVGYINSRENVLFTSSSTQEYFFGNSTKDVIEIGVYNSQKQPITSSTLVGFTTTTKFFYRYEDIDNNVFRDYYFPPNSNLIQNGNRDVLISVKDIVEQNSITDANFYLSLTPISNFFSQTNPLIIKEISNSRREIKLVKSFNSENVVNNISVTFDGNQILFDGNKSLSLKSGTVYNLNFVSGDITLVKFSKIKDGSFNGGVEYVNNVIYKPSTRQIILDTTEDFPVTLFAYNKNHRNSGVEINFPSRVSDSDFKLNSEFLSLGYNTFINNRIYDDFEYYVNTFNITDVYNLTKDNFKSEINSLKQLFGLAENDSDGVFEILRSVFYGETIYDGEIQKSISYLGIKDYLLNYLKFNYEFVNTFNNFNTSVNEINFAACDKKLLRRLASYKSPSNFPADVRLQYADSLKYLYGVFNVFLKNTLTTIESDFKNKFKSPLKNALKINGQIFPILTLKINGNELWLKLKDGIPSEYVIGDFSDIVNISIEPFFQTINFESSVKKNTIKLNKPNFSIDINELSARTLGTKYYTSDELEVNRNIKNKIDVNKKIANINVDYTDFSKFVIFSSANLRVKIFKNKISRITVLEEENDELESFDPTNSATNDKIGVYNKIELNNKEIDSIFASFDGYESYLYKTGYFIYDTSSETFVESTTDSSASSYVATLDTDSAEYDINNRDSLINNTPEYVYNDTDNDEYLKFLSMVGHHFDNIYLYISNIGIYKNIGDDTSTGLTGKLITNILNGFGFKVPPGLSGTLEYSEVDELYLNSSESNKYNNSISVDDKTKTIWKRLLTNLPSIYKSKGTEECLRQIFAIYGIPNNLILVKEFGGGYTQNEISSSYTIEEKEYLLEFIGSEEERVEFVNLEPFKSVDFKLYIDTTKYPTSQVIVPIHSSFSGGDQIYSFGFIKISDTLGSLYFVIKSGDESFAAVTEPFYMFNGEVMSLLLRKNPIDSNFETASDDNLVPTRYDICVHRNEYCLEPIDKKFSFYLSGSLNTAFDNVGGLTYFGNVDTNLNLISELGNIPTANQSVLLEDEVDDLDLIAENDQENFFLTEIGGYEVVKFYGCLDKFVFQSVALSDENFYIKCKNFNSYYQGQPSSSYEEILFRFHFGIPFDVSYSSSQLTGFRVDNANRYYSSAYALMYNFTGSNISDSFDTSSCVSQSYSLFPHQSREFDISNEYFTGEVGPSRFENDKVEYTSLTTLDNTLSPTNTRTSKSKYNYYSDANKLGIFLSPIHERNKDILNFFGDYEIVSSISDPREKFGRKYLGLETLRKNYYGENYINRILFNELFTIYKIFVDKSIFDTLKNVLPARNRVYKGILVEPTILERSRIEEKAVFIGEIQTLDAIIDLKEIIADIDQGELISLNASEIPVAATSNVNSTFVTNTFSAFENIQDTPDKYMVSIFPNTFGYVEFDGQTYKAYTLNEKRTLSYSDDGVDSNNVVKDFKKVTLVISGSSFVTSSAYTTLTDVENFRHISRKNIPFRKELYFDTGSLDTGLVYTGKSRQTKFTTINEPNESDREPIITIPVGASIKNMEGGITV